MCTPWLPVCSTGTPMVRGGGGDIPGNDPGQGFTSPSTCTHVKGVSGAPTAAVGAQSFAETAQSFAETAQSFAETAQSIDKLNVLF